MHALSCIVTVKRLSQKLADIKGREGRTEDREDRQKDREGHQKDREGHLEEDHEGHVRPTSSYLDLVSQTREEDKIKKGRLCDY